MSLKMSFSVRSICVLFSVVCMLSMIIGVGLYCEFWCCAVVLFLLLLFSLVLLSFVCPCVVVVSIVSTCVVFCVSVLVVFIVVLGGLVLLSVEFFTVVVFCVSLYIWCVVVFNPLFPLKCKACRLFPVYNVGLFCCLVVVYSFPLLPHSFPLPRSVWSLPLRCRCLMLFVCMGLRLSGSRLLLVFLCACEFCLRVLWCGVIVFKWRLLCCVVALSLGLFTFFSFIVLVICCLLFCGDGGLFCLLEFR